MAARSLLALVVCLSLAAACTPPPAPKQLPPQTVTPTPDPPPPSDPPPPAPERPSTVVVVDHGGKDETPPQTLADAARAEKERRQALGKPAVKITDKNLAEYAAKGQITTAKPTPPPATNATDAKTAVAVKNAQDEEYWRKRGLEIRQRWHDAVEEGKKQQSAVERLRTQFYSEDDPYVRDGRIKPEWDRALDRLDQARRDGEAAKRDLDAFTDEGYRAGALQAWLEEGIDLEPPHAPAKKDKPNEPGEPKVIQDHAREPSTPPPA